MRLRSWRFGPAMRAVGVRATWWLRMSVCRYAIDTMVKGRDGESVSKGRGALTGGLCCNAKHAVVKVPSVS